MIYAIVKGEVRSITEKSTTGGKKYSIAQVLIKDDKGYESLSAIKFMNGSASKIKTGSVCEVGVHIDAFKGRDDSARVSMVVFA